MRKHKPARHALREPGCPQMAGGVKKRTFLKVLGGFAVLLGTGFTGLFQTFDRLFRQAGAKPRGSAEALASEKTPEPPPVTRRTPERLGADQDGLSRVYMARGDVPEKNMAAVLAMMGGIQRFIGRGDIVVLKPNAQWWNQGMTNTNAMKAFMEAVLTMPGFKGEIIICDNHQFADTNSRGWTTQHRNGDFNYNELVQYFQRRGHRNVTKYHWQCAGPNPDPLQGDAASLAKRVRGPEDGDGYVWREDMVYTSPLNRRCMLTYPVFTSSHSGTTIDLKNGAWKDGTYTGQPVKLINFSALNHHGPYVGFTGSVKNFMGIVDMTCGFQGPTPKWYFNTHYIGLRDMNVPFSERMPWRIRRIISQYNYRYFHHTGAVLGRFMKDIKKADLNIITAHWVGYGSRTDTQLSGYPRALLASTDPVALDYVASRDVLLPLTIAEAPPQYRYLADMNDATLPDGLSHPFLMACHEQGIGNIDPRFIQVVNTESS